MSERRGAALGWLSALGGFAISLTPLVASRLIPWLGWRQTWVVLSVVVLVGSWSLAGLTSRRARDESVGAPDLGADPLPSSEDERLATDPTGDVVLVGATVHHRSSDPSEALDSPAPDGDTVAGLDVELGETDVRRRRWGFAVVASGFATVACRVSRSSEGDAAGRRHYRGRCCGRLRAMPWVTCSRSWSWCCSSSW